VGLYTRARRPERIGHAWMPALLLGTPVGSHALQLLPSSADLDE
jgi:hypothetical protein